MVRRASLGPGQKVCALGCKPARASASSPRSLCPMDSSGSRQTRRPVGQLRLDGGAQEHRIGGRHQRAQLAARTGSVSTAAALNHIQEGLGGPKAGFSSRNAAASTPRRTASCRRRAPAGHAVPRRRPASAPCWCALPSPAGRGPLQGCRSPGSGSVSTTSMSGLGIDPSGDMVTSTFHPHHLTNGVAFADEPGTCYPTQLPRTPLDQAGDIHEI